MLKEKHEFTENGVYCMPPDGDKKMYMDYLKSLPTEEGPEVFGMHGNANIAFQLQETRKFLDTVLLMQPRVAAAAGKKTPAEMVAELAQRIGETLC